MKLLVHVALVPLIVLVSAASAYSCSCADPTPTEKFRAAKTVFVGKIVEVKPSTILKGALQYFPEVVKFKVEKQWKGAKKSEIIILASFDAIGMCGDLALTAGESYLIYAYRINGRLVIDRDCGPSRLLKHAAADIKLLEK